MGKLSQLLKGESCTRVPDLYFKECCDSHDLAYVEKKVSRAQADREFFACMQRDARTPVGKFIIAPLYWLGVRLFGGRYWKKA